MTDFSLRGGSWVSSPHLCRAAIERSGVGLHSGSSSISFRLVLPQ